MDMVRFRVIAEMPSLFIHAAGGAAGRGAYLPLVDHKVNASLTVDLLEIVRLHCPECVFIYPSSSQVYGEHVNQLRMDEFDTHYWPSSKVYTDGVLEGCRIDQSLRGPHGASKLCADLMCQEYGKFYNLNIGIFRCSQIAGTASGLLTHLVQCALTEKPFAIHGYKGKQVRDVLHVDDLLDAFHLFYEHPAQGEVFNMGGGKGNAHSVLQYIALCSEVLKKTITAKQRFHPDKADYIWYVSNTYKFENAYPCWDASTPTWGIIEDLAKGITV